MFDWYLDWEYRIAFTQLFFAMLGMGATLRLQDLAALVRAPKPLALGLFTQLGVIPLIAVGIAHAAELSPGETVGLVLIGAVPGGTLSNVVCYLAGANYALSIAMTTISTLGCLITTPLLLRTFADASLPASFEMPVMRIAAEISLGLLLPLFAGMMIGIRIEEKSAAFTRNCIRLSLLTIAVMIIGSTGAGRVDAAAWGALPLYLFLFSTLALLAGALPGLLLNIAREDRAAIGVETCIRNTNLALLVKASIFPAVAGVADPFVDGVFAVVILAGGVQILPAIPAIVAFRRKWI